MSYLFEVSTLNDDGNVTILADKVKQWKHQMKTHYSNLPINERKSDLKQAQKVINVIDASV
jgi:hypothetical protein